MSPDTPHREDPLEPAVLEQAAEWMLRLHDGAGSEADRLACERWRNASPANARAWARVERLQDLFGQVPPAIALPVLGRPADAGRRNAIKHLALLLSAAPGGWLGWQLWQRSEWSADQRTATGERRQLRLPDGSRVELDTATALDLRFDASERSVRLREGRILVETAADPIAPPRPFRVRTAFGNLQALGTRFEVRAIGGRHRIMVLEGAVRLGFGLPTVETRVVNAGQLAWFDAHGCSAPLDADPAQAAWVGGMLAADRMPLGELIGELARYRSGRLRCDPEVAALAVSGAFPLDDIERSLAMLEAIYPVAVRRGAGGWWITVGPRGA
ncbi:DUF4880 domain-containing protein [Stenotrophomonas sp. MYb238]|uniref:FecR domain-containing protein n=1 Tax=Stenotrophomonas sp. MYb238 TaxID=2040281 RepID=UPI00129130A5|nr:FecR family protein [Stenotrophomonas sp. MYb238]MQP75638.1 DUF4880 domain-containing protein [Stenotrophomonas sp. MYb238]